MALWSLHYKMVANILSKQNNNLVYVFYEIMLLTANYILLLFVLTII